MSAYQPATSPTDQMASQTRPKTFMSLPKELRDQIYELAFFSKPRLVVLAGKERPSEYEGPSNPEMTVQVASKYSVSYPWSFATFGGHNARYATWMHNRNAYTTPTSFPVPKDFNWSKSLTGILYVSKQISCEAAPYLYKSCTFFFEELELSKKFLEAVRPANLEAIRNIFVYYPDGHEVVYFPDGALADYTVCMRQNFYLLCEKIVQAIPKIKELTIWIGRILELENEGTRVDAHEKAILQFAGLAELENVSVKKYGDALDNSGDRNARWEGSNEYTVDGVKEMITTGDHAALDRMRKAFEDARDKEC